MFLYSYRFESWNALKCGIGHSINKCPHQNMVIIQIQNRKLKRMKNEIEKNKIIECSKIVWNYTSLLYIIQKIIGIIDTDTYRLIIDRLLHNTSSYFVFRLARTLFNCCNAPHNLSFSYMPYVETCYLTNI